MNSSGNPLLDDDEEYDGELPEVELPEDFKLPSEIPLALPKPAQEPEREPISSDSELPDLNSLLGTLDLGNDRMSSGVGEESYSGDAFDVDPFSSETFDEPLGEPIDLSSSLEGIGLGFDDDDWRPETPARNIKDFASPQALEDDYDFEGTKLDLDAIVSRAIELGASDIDLVPQDEVVFKILGEISREKQFGVIQPNMTIQLQQSIISSVLEQFFVEDLELDTSYVVKSGAHKGRRLRLSVGKSDGNVFLSFRVIAKTMPTPDELEIPQAMRNWVNLPSGLILVNGPTGSGKSTTLSSLVQEIQFNRPHKVITVEKPVEFVYGVKPGQKASIVQREVGRDTRSFAAGLTSAMRQFPDVILVGEVRNRLEIDELLRAAETGHLALSTMHTTSGPTTINRIRSLYQGDEQLRILGTLADNLRGTMTQTLVKSPDGKSRFAVREVLEVDREVSGYILNGDVPAIRSYQERHGITMEHELAKVVKAGKTTAAIARLKAPNPLFFDQLVAG